MRKEGKRKLVKSYANFRMSRDKVLAYTYPDLVPHQEQLQLSEEKCGARFQCMKIRT